MKFSLLHHRLNLSLFKLIGIGLHNLIALTLRKSLVRGSVVLLLRYNLCRWCLVIHLKLITPAHTAIVKVFQLSIIWIVFKRHRWVEQLHHLTWPLKFSLIVVTWTIFFSLSRLLRLVFLDESDLGLKDFAWILLLHLVLILGNLYGWSELLWSDLVVSCHWLRIWQVYQVILIGIFNC